MAGLLALLGGKPKGGSEMSSKEGAPESPLGGDAGPEKTYAQEAFDAVKEDDFEGFYSALKGFVRACSKKEEADGYEPEE